MTVWWICAYIASVVMCMLALRFMYRHIDSKPDIIDVLVSLIPIGNIGVAIVAILIGLYRKGLPCWLYRLYGGK